MKFIARVIVTLVILWFYFAVFGFWGGVGIFVFWVLTLIAES